MCLSIILKHIISPDQYKGNSRSCSLSSILVKFNFKNIKSMLTGHYDLDYQESDIKWCYAELKKQTSNTCDNIDFLWLMMIFLFQFKSIKLLNITEETEDIIYQIKQFDPYYGYLANGNHIIKLILSFRKVLRTSRLSQFYRTKVENQEAYIMLWNYYYNQPLQNYQNKKKDLIIAKKILQRFRHISQYIYFYNLIIAKTFYKYQRKNDILFFLLQHSSQNNPQQIAYLYKAAKYILKLQQNEQIDFFQVQDILEECLRRAEPIFYDEINYLYGKIYYFNYNETEQYISWSKINLINLNDNKRKDIQWFLEQKKQNNQLIFQINNYKERSKVQNHSIQNYLQNQNYKIQNQSLKMIEILIYFSVDIQQIQEFLVNQLEIDKKNFKIGILLCQVYSKQNKILDLYEISKLMYENLEQYPSNYFQIFKISKIYSKVLFKMKQYVNAIDVLLDLHYIFQWQKTNTLQNNNPNNYASNTSRYSSINSISYKTDKNNTDAHKLFQQQFEENRFTENNWSDNELDQHIKSIKQNLYKKQTVNLNQYNSVDEKNQYFQIFTDSSFLYLFAKFCQKCNEMIRYGLNAIEYFIEQKQIHNYFQDTFQYEKKLLKAKYRKGLLLVQDNQILKGIKLLQSILIDLLQFNYKRKLKRVQITMLIHKKIIH